MMTRNVLLRVFLLTLCVGCVAVGEKYSPAMITQEPGKSVVLVYRPRPPPDILLMNTYSYVHTADLYYGEKELISISAGSFTYIKLDPGKQVFSIREQLTGGELKKLEFETQPGQTYYLRYDFRFGALADDAMSFRIMPSAIAEEEITKTRYKPVKD